MNKYLYHPQFNPKWKRNLAVAAYEEIRFWGLVILMIPIATVILTYFWIEDKIRGLDKSK